MKRRKMSKQSSRRSFRKGIMRTNAKNLPRGIQRGGYRL